MNRWNNADTTLLCAALCFLVAVGFKIIYPESILAEGFLFVTEAAMVGGIADWFAVTALFKKPLGFPFHTAILPKRREEFVSASTKMVQNEFFSRLFSKDYKTVVTELRLASRSGKKFAYEEAVEQTGVLRDYQQSLADFGERERQLEGMLGAAYKGVASDWRLSGSLVWTRACLCFPCVYGWDCLCRGKAEFCFLRGAPLFPSRFVQRQCGSA